MSPRLRSRARLPLVAAVAAIAVLAWGAPARADTFEIDREHTEVRFTWDHLGISRQSGRLVDVTGTLEFDEARPETSRVRATMKLASLWTGVAKLDQLLVRGKDYFDTERHPTIEFESTGVRMTGQRTAEITGDLTINGKAVPVVLAATWNYAGEHPLAKINPAFSGVHVAGFSATGAIRRSDWGITRFAPFVSDEIQISIETELKRTGIVAPLPLPPPDDAGAAKPAAAPGAARE